MSEEGTDPNPTCPHCGRLLTVPPLAEDHPANLFDDKNVRAAILESIEAGNYYEVACVEAGVSAAGAKEWRRRGLDQRERRVLGKYRAFVEECEAAELRGEGRLVGIVANATIDNPHLALQFLQIRHPKRWIQEMRMVIESDRDKLLAAVFKEFADEPRTLRRFLGRIAGAPLPAGAAGAGQAVDGSVVRALGPGDPQQGP